MAGFVSNGPDLAAFVNGGQSQLWYPEKKADTAESRGTHCQSLDVQPFSRYLSKVSAPHLLPRTPIIHFTSPAAHPCMQYLFASSLFIHITQILQKRFLSCRAAHSLEGYPEIDKCPNDGVSLRESQLIPQPHRMHCPQPQAAVLSLPAPQRELGMWLERCTSALLELWLQRMCFMP